MKDKKYIIPTDDEFVTELNKLKNNDKFLSLIRTLGKPPYSLLSIYTAPVLWFYRDEIKKAAITQQTKNSKLQYVGMSEIHSSGVSFPPSHPRELTAYIQHPVDDGTYITMANFHRVVFEHKVAEATNFLMALGAKSLKIESVKGWGKEFSADLEGSLASAGIKGHCNNSQKVVYEATLNPVGEPHLPDSLVWYDFEPSWQSLAKGRLNHGLTNFTVLVCYEDDFGVDAKLKSNVNELEVSLGGSFEEHTSTVWKMVGSF